MHLDYKEISRIHEKYYNPRIPSDQVYFRDPHNTRSFEFAVVCDNKDPEAQGRVKVYFPLYGENMISDWIPVLKQFAGPGKGFWALPDPGQKVICTFLENDMSMPIVMGSVYGPNCMPPIEDNTENNIKVLTSEFGSVIVMDDTEGAERLIVSMKDHQMRVVLDKETGLSIVNELGDIDISCRKFTVEGADTGTVTMSKGLSISTGENCAIKVSKGMEYKSGADVIVKGSA
ncbi:MAG: hypothetical protein GY754_45990, partial [bacterium]|nr:hypothetical protein [bacterium]